MNKEPFCEYCEIPFKECTCSQCCEVDGNKVRINYKWGWENAGGDDYKENDCGIFVPKEK